MKQIIIFFGILLILAGLSLVVDPDIVYNFIIERSDDLWLYVTAISVRLLMGFMLIWTASESRYPIVIKILGYLFIAAAIVIILLGHEQFQEIISSLIPELRSFDRIGGLIGMAFGGFLVYSLTGKK